MKKVLFVFFLVIFLVGCNKNNSNISFFKYKYGFGESKYTSYEIKSENGKYRLKYENRENGNVTAKFTYIKKSEVSKIDNIISKYEIDKWDGFDESNNSFLDGSFFELDIKYNNGENVKATGYMKTPDNYETGHNALIDLLESFIKK